jgi:hypothetical protein
MSILSGSAPLPQEKRPAPAEPNLGILTEVPLPARLGSALRKFLTWYSRFYRVQAFLMVLAILWFISAPARHMITQWWLVVVLLVVLLIATSGLGILKQNSLVRILRVMLGPPAWGDAGGLETRLFRATFRAAPDVRLVFNAADRKRISKLSELDIEVTRIGARHNFFEARTSEGVDEAVVEEQWKEAWKRIQNDPVEGDVSYADIRRDYPDAVLTVPLWLIGSLSATLMLDFFTLITIWLGYRWAAHMGSALPIVEAILFFSFVIPAWLFIIRVYRASTVPIGFIPREKLVESGINDDSLLSEIDEIRGVSVRPLTVQLGPRYVKEQLTFSIRAFAIDLGTRVLTILPLVALALAGGILFGHGSASSLTDTYLRLMLVIVIAPIGLLAGYYLASVLLQDVRKSVAPVVSGLVGAGLPLLGQYFLTGSIGNNPRAVASAIVLGLIGVAAASLAEIVKARFEARPKTSEAS